MNKVEITDTDGRKIIVNGIYYISNNNYYFIFTKEEMDNDGHIILYILKILQEVTNTQNGPAPTGFLIGVKITDDNEYNLVKQDIVNIVNEKQTKGSPVVRYLDLAMLQNLKVKDYRIFKLEKSIYEQNLKNVEENLNNNEQADNYQIRYEEQIKINEQLQNTIDSLNSKIDAIKEVLKEN